jgi:VanZ family protein
VTLARRIDLWLPPLLVMAAIFALSAQPDLSSGLGVIDVIGRKLIHAAEYALLCALWWRFLRELMPSRSAALAAFCVSLAYAVTDEYHQSLVEGRNGTPIDVAIDAAGAGLAAVALVRRPARSRA